MTSHEFVLWFKGFAQATNNYNITPKQWDDIREQLGKVKENGSYSISVGTGSSGTTNTTADIKNNITYKTDIPQTLTK